MRILEVSCWCVTAAGLAVVAVMTVLRDPKHGGRAGQAGTEKPVDRRLAGLRVFLDVDSVERSQRLRATHAPNKKAIKRERNGASIVPFRNCLAKSVAERGKSVCFPFP